MCFEWIIFGVALVILIVSIVVYNKNRKCGCLNNEQFKDSVYSYLNAYNSVYAPPRPQFYTDCVSYNQWVRDANHLGKMIAKECKKKFPNDERCPRNNPWEPTPCGL